MFSQAHFLYGKWKKIAFEAPLGFEATYDVHLSLIGKLVGNFLLVIVELFSLGAFVLSQYTRLTDGRMDRQTDGQTESRQQYRAYMLRIVAR